MKCFPRIALVLARAVKDEVHAVGVQVGITFVPANAALNFHCFSELDAADRFQGESVGLNFVMKF